MGSLLANMESDVLPEWDTLQRLPFFPFATVRVVEERLPFAVGRTAEARQEISNGFAWLQVSRRCVDLSEDSSVRRAVVVEPCERTRLMTAIDDSFDAG